MTKKNLGEKLLEFHQKMGPLSKDQTAKAGKFEYKYLDINRIIEEIKPILNECGIVVAQPLDMKDGKLVMTTRLINAEDCQDEMSYSCPLPVLNDPQKQGGVVTYYRRYCLQSLLCLQAEDDDAKIASESITHNQVQTIYSLASEEKVMEILKEQGYECVNDITRGQADNFIKFLRRKR
jgi:hypothetical protein